MLDNISNQPSKFRKEDWVQIIDELRGTYTVNTQIKFKTSILRSSSCNCGGAYILAKGNISVNNTAGAGADTNKKVTFKSYAPSTDCISEINNTQ